MKKIQLKHPWLDFENTLDDQLRFSMRYQFEIIKTDTQYYIEWDGLVYRNRRTGNMYFDTRNRAIKALAKMITNRCWGMYSNNKREAYSIIYCDILHLISNGRIKIQKVKFTEEE